MSLLIQITILMLAVFAIWRFRKSPSWGAYVLTLAGFATLWVVGFAAAAFAYATDPALHLALLMAPVATVFGGGLFALAGLILMLRRR